MKRKTKNIITSSIVIILIGITLLTIYLAQNSIKNSIPTMDFNNPMQNNNSKDFSNDMNNNQDENKIEESKENSNNNMNNTNEQKGIPNGEEPSTKPEEKGEKPPTKPDDNNQFDKQNEGNPPAKPDDNNNMMQGGMMPPNENNIPMMNENANNNINIWYGNIANSSLKLYDKVDKGEYIGEVNGDILYISYTKGNKTINAIEIFKNQ